MAKQTIMESAMRFFSEKGYDGTSIQEIADDCRIAKGSLYKFFPSKEDLLLEIYLTQVNKLHDKLDAIRRDKALDPRDAFIREIECNFEFFFENKFIMREFKTLSSTSSKIGPYLHRMRSGLIESSKNGLLQYAGKDLEPNIWELVCVLNGITKEFIHLVVFDNKPLNVRDLSAFIADRIDSLANDIRTNKRVTVVPGAVMEELLQAGESCSRATSGELRAEMLRSARTTIQELTVTNHRKKELEEAVALLEAEFDSDEPKPVILLALLQYLSFEYPLAYIAKQLEKYVSPTS
ncbi:TetR/AcrR family transcriptional regulator [Cohnella suwonensis]|uniref:TetR/AcrR family transcriptional regulator n=1 Tax=Cohnella suwonensis TaxID=696072 RepID=A0ABW0LYB7_9BACL